LQSSSGLSEIFLIQIFTNYLRRHHLSFYCIYPAAAAVFLKRLLVATIYSSSGSAFLNTQTQPEKKDGNILAAIKGSGIVF